MINMKRCLKFFLSLFFVVCISNVVLYSVKNGINNPYGSQKELNKKYSKATKFFEKGIKLYSTAQIEEAQKELERCIGIFPHYYKARFTLARIFLKKRNLGSALNYIEEAKKNLVLMFKWDKDTRKTSVNRLKQLETYWLERLDKKRAIGEATEVKDAGQYMVCANNIEAYIMKIRNRLKELRESEMSIPVKYYYVHGNIFFRKGEYAKAKAQYLKAVDQDPDHAKSFFNLSTIFFREKHYLKALRYLKLAAHKGIEVQSKSMTMLNRALDRFGEGDWGAQYPAGVYGISLRIGRAKNQLYENLYLAYDVKTGDAVIIDPGAVDKKVEKFIKDRNLTVKFILNTHGHYDHIGANRYYADYYGVKIASHIGDKGLYNGLNKKNIPDQYFSDENNIEAGSLKITLLPVKGHTSGSTCFLINGTLFTGDSLSKGTIGNVDGDDKSDSQKLLKQMVDEIGIKLMKLPGETFICPGHGPPSSIMYEKKSNPFLNEI